MVYAALIDAHDRRRVRHTPLAVRQQQRNMPLWVLTTLKSSPGLVDRRLLRLLKLAGARRMEDTGGG